MRFSCIIIIFLIFLLLSCTQAKTKDNHPIENISETTNIVPSTVNPAPVDDYVIIGGYRTNYRFSRQYITFSI
ncbi:MAG: hypothetical protein LBI06_08330, partial [Treponema sp.]|nr:hypothetical protein [Treponema sp.]